MIPRPSSEAELRRGEKLWGHPSPEAAKPKMRIISGKRVAKGSLCFVCKIGLPFGSGELEIADVMVFTSRGKSWANLPSKPVLDQHGVHMTDGAGKKVYAPFLAWSSKEIRERFSNAVVELARTQYPDALDPAP